MPADSKNIYQFSWVMDQHGNADLDVAHMPPVQRQALLDALDRGNFNAVLTEHNGKPTIEILSYNNRPGIQRHYLNARQFMAQRHHQDVLHLPWKLERSAEKGGEFYRIDVTKWNATDKQAILSKLEVYGIDASIYDTKWGGKSFIDIKPDNTQFALARQLVQPYTNIAHPQHQAEPPFYSYERLEENPNVRNGDYGVALHDNGGFYCLRKHGGADPIKDSDGWKFHISVQADQIGLAWNKVAEYLVAHKIVDAKVVTREEAQMQAGSHQDGKAITVYCVKDGTDYKQVAKDIEKILIDNGIRPGARVQGDRRVNGSNYMSYRDDFGGDARDYQDYSKRYQQGKEIAETLPEDKKYNPFNRPDPFADLNVSPRRAQQAAPTVSEAKAATLYDEIMKGNAYNIDLHGFQPAGSNNCFFNFDLPGAPGIEDHYKGDGWKFHLSVDAADIPRAYDALLPILSKHGVQSFKVTTPYGSERFSDPTNSQAGKNFTLYGARKDPNFRWDAVIKDIEQRFVELNIKPGTNVISGDRMVPGSRYAGYRNEIARGKVLDFLENGVTGGVPNWTYYKMSGEEPYLSAETIRMLIRDGIVAPDMAHNPCGQDDHLKHVNFTSQSQAQPEKQATRQTEPQPVVVEAQGLGGHEIKFHFNSKEEAQAMAQALHNRQVNAYFLQDEHGWYAAASEQELHMRGLTAEKQNAVYEEIKIPLEKSYTAADQSHLFSPEMDATAAYELRRQLASPNYGDKNAIVHMIAEKLSNGQVVSFTVTNASTHADGQTHVDAHNDGIVFKGNAQELARMKAEFNKLGINTVLEQEGSSFHENYGECLRVRTADIAAIKDLYSKAMQLNASSRYLPVNTPDLRTPEVIIATAGEWHKGMNAAGTRQNMRLSLKGMNLVQADAVFHALEQAGVPIVAYAEGQIVAGGEGVVDKISKIVTQHGPSTQINNVVEHNAAPDYAHPALSDDHIIAEAGQWIMRRAVESNLPGDKLGICVPVKDMPQPQRELLMQALRNKGLEPFPRQSGELGETIFVPGGWESAKIIGDICTPYNHAIIKNAQGNWIPQENERGVKWMEMPLTGMSPSERGTLYKALERQGYQPSFTSDPQYGDIISVHGDQARYLKNVIGNPNHTMAFGGVETHTQQSSNYSHAERLQIIDHAQVLHDAVYSRAQNYFQQQGLPLNAPSYVIDPTRNADHVMMANSARNELFLNTQNILNLPLSPDARAAIMAHEYAHLARKDQSCTDHLLNSSSLNHQHSLDQHMYEAELRADIDAARITGSPQGIAKATLEIAHHNGRLKNMPPVLTEDVVRVCMREIRESYKTNPIGHTPNYPTLDQRLENLLNNFKGDVWRKASVTPETTIGQQREDMTRQMPLSSREQTVAKDMLAHLEKSGFVGEHAPTSKLDWFEKKLHDAIADGTPISKADLIRAQQQMHEISTQYLSTAQGHSSDFQVKTMESINALRRASAKAGELSSLSHTPDVSHVREVPRTYTETEKTALLQHANELMAGKVTENSIAAHEYGAYVKDCVERGVEIEQSRMIAANEQLNKITALREADIAVSKELHTNGVTMNDHLSGQSNLGDAVVVFADRNKTLNTTSQSISDHVLGQSRPLITADQLNWDNATHVVSNAQKFVLPIPAWNENGQPLVYPAGHEKAGQPITDWQGKPIGDKGLVFMNYKDNAYQAVMGDGHGVIIMNQVTEQQAMQLRDKIHQYQQDPAYLTPGQVQDVLAYAKNELGISDVYNSDKGFIGNKMTPVDQGLNFGAGGQPVEAFGLFKRDDRDVCQAIRIEGAGEFQGPAATPQKFENGAVIVKQGESIRLVQPGIFEETYRFSDPNHPMNHGDIRYQDSKNPRMNLDGISSVQLNNPSAPQPHTITIREGQSNEVSGNAFKMSDAPTPTATKPVSTTPHTAPAANHEHVAVLPAGPVVNHSASIATDAVIHHAQTDRLPDSHPNPQASATTKPAPATQPPSAPNGQHNGTVTPATPANATPPAAQNSTQAPADQTAHVQQGEHGAAPAHQHVMSGVGLAMSTQEWKAIDEKIKRGEEVTTAEYTAATINTGSSMLEVTGKSLDDAAAKTLGKLVPKLERAGGPLVQVALAAPTLYTAYKSGDTKAIGAATWGTAGGIGAGMAGQALIPIPGVGFVVGVVVGDGAAKIGGLVNTMYYNDDPAQREAARKELKEINHNYNPLEGDPGRMLGNAMNLTGAAVSSVGNAVTALGQVTTYGGEKVTELSHAAQEWNNKHLYKPVAAITNGLVAASSTVTSASLKVVGKTVEIAGNVVNTAGEAWEYTGHKANAVWDYTKAGVTKVASEIYKNPSKTLDIVATHASNAVTKVANGVAQVGHDIEKKSKEMWNSCTTEVMSWFGHKEPEHKPTASSPPTPSATAVHKPRTAAEVDAQLNARLNQLEKAGWTKLLDKDGDGHIELDELKKALAAKGVNMAAVANITGEINGKVITDMLNAPAPTSGAKPSNSAHR